MEHSGTFYNYLRHNGFLYYILEHSETYSFDNSLDSET